MSTPALDEVATRLADGPLADLVRHEHPLGSSTTYKVGGAARVAVTVPGPDGLGPLMEVTASTGVPTLVIGRGSNLLVADAGFDGLAVFLGEGFASVSVDDTTVVAGGSAALPVVARRTVHESLTGFEWAVGVPGTIGGAVRMNAGGHGSDMAAALTSATVADLGSGESTVWSAERLAFGYRRSAVGAADVVVDATLGLAAGDRSEGESALAEIVRWRREHQPGGQNAGSVFTNPEGDSAGRLIDTAGAKGLRVGTAEVSTKHANFIQADANGSADDVLALMRQVIDRVRAEHGVELEIETRLIGFAGEGS